MAVANDEWNGELTQFLDRLPARPCMMPPAPSFCSVCGSINGPVAHGCRFFALRHERERGQTFIELAPKKRPDTFEIELDFEEEEDFVGGDMFEFSRPATTTAVKGKIAPQAAPRIEKPVEVEVYEAEVVEVIEEPDIKAPPKLEPAVAPAEKKPAAPKEPAGELAKKAGEEIKAEKKPGEPPKKEEQRIEPAPKIPEEKRPEPAKKAEAPLEPAPKTLEKTKAPGKEILSREESERLEREIEEELAKAGLDGAEAGEAEPEAPKAYEQPVQMEKVIAPIYSQPIIKIIPPEGERPKGEPPLPPPPPGYGGPMPPGAPKPTEGKPAELPPPPPMEEAPPAPELPPAPEAPPKAPEPGIPASPRVDEKTAPPAAQEKQPPPSTAPGQRRTGGLYDIFRKKPKEKPRADNGKNGVDEELGKRLKKGDK